VQSIYKRLYKGCAKGGTGYVTGSRDSQILPLSSEENKAQNIELFSMKEARSVDNSNALRQLGDQAESEHVKSQTHTDDVVFGSAIGDTCSICRSGIVQYIGVCITCTNCNAQLRCGL